MAVKAVGTWVAGFCEIGGSDIGGRRAIAGAAGPNWRSEVSMVGGRLERAGVCMKPVEDVKPMKDENFSSVPPSSEVDGEALNGGADEQLGKLNRDLPSGLLPRFLISVKYGKSFTQKAVESKMSSHNMLDHGSPNLPKPSGSERSKPTGRKPGWFSLPNRNAG